MTSASKFNKRQEDYNSLDLSVVIVNWNVSDILDNCIQSIVKECFDLKYEIIVVDNRSTDNSLTMLQKKYPWVIVIANSENIGFARANNQGIAIASGKYVFILNPDTLIVENCLQNLIQILEEQPSVGMVGPKLIYPDGKIQPSCARRLPTLISFLFLNVFRFQHIPIIGKWILDKMSTPYSYSQRQKVEAISGAAMLARHGLIKELHGFGEDFIHTGEDIDLCARINRKGWEIIYDCDSIIVHYGGQSSTKVPLRTMINAEISQQKYILRNYGVIQAYIYKLFILLIQAPTTLAIGICKYLIRRETFDQLRIRLMFVKEIWKWKEVA